MPTLLQNIKQIWPDVRKVVDAKFPMDLNITEKDCKHAKPKDPANCALAIGMMRKFDAALICRSTALGKDGKRAIRYTVPSSIHKEIACFDRGAGFDPGKYWLNAPSKCQKLGKRHYPRPVLTDPDKKYPRRKNRTHATRGLREPLQQYLKSKG